jgi:hypothetical protein
MPATAALRTKKPKIHKTRAAITALTLNIGSVAMSIEALETLLIEKGVLKDDELMDRLKKVAQEHWSKGQNIPPSED